jgi:hypothetical protein
MQTVYQYNAKGFYVGETTAYMVTPEKGEAYVSMPHNTTAIAPEIKKGFIPRWTGEAWEQVEDYRGETGYINGVYTEIKEPGALPEGWTTEAPPVTYSITKSIEYIETLIQARLDDFARTLTYSNMLSACTYATSHNPTYAIEGQYCIEARDSTWDAAYVILNTMMAEISGSGKEAFTQDELDALWLQIKPQLPVLKWPEGSRGNNA